MQDNVNAQQENPNSVNVINSLVTNFGDLAISCCDGGVIKLQVKELGNGDILSISNLLQWADIRIKRSNTRVLALFVPKPWFGEYSAETLKALETIEADMVEDIPLKTVRDYFELQLLPEYRLAAFHNAIKKKLDWPAKNLHDAFCVAMDNDLGGCKEGIDFWYEAINRSGYNC